MKSKLQKILEYGDQFIFIDEKFGELPSECMSFKYGIEPGKALIFIKQNASTFMYASVAGQHERPLDALKYCKAI